MPIPTTTDQTKRMSTDEVRRYNEIGKAVSGMPSDRAVALLMAAICAVIDHACLPQIWLAIKDGAEEELRLAKGRMQ